MDEPVKVLAIDPAGCGCTECCTGEYVPLERATDEQLIDLLTGDIENNASLVTLTWNRDTRYGWGDLIAFSIGGRSWWVEDLSEDPRERARKLTPDDIHCTS